jgi:hypothetical protein
MTTPTKMTTSTIALRLSAALTTFTTATTKNSINIEKK